MSRASEANDSEPQVAAASDRRRGDLGLRMGVRRDATSGNFKIKKTPAATPAAESGTRLGEGSRCQTTISPRQTIPLVSNVFQEMLVRTQ